MNYDKPPIPERLQPTTDAVKAELGKTSLIHCNEDLEPLVLGEEALDE